MVIHPVRICVFFATCLLVLSNGIADETNTADATLERIRARGSLIWGADQEGGGPFVFPDERDPTRVLGFEVELAALIAESLGVRAEFSQGQWDKLPDLVDRGDIDIVLNGYEWTPNRAERYGVSIPYYIYELQLLARKDDTSLRSWEDLLQPLNGRKRRVSLLGGSAAQDYVEAFAGDRVDLSQFDGATDAMEAAQLGLSGIDANVQDLPVWNFYSSGFPEIHAVGDPVGRGYYVAMVRKQDGELLRLVNEAILKALQDGRLRRIFSQYGMWNKTQAARGLELSSDGGFVGEKSADELSPDGDKESDAKAYHSSGGWNVIRSRGPILWDAAKVTILLSVISMPLAVGIGLIMALARLYGPWYASKFSSIYVELIRGTPLVLQLYVIYFLIPKALAVLFPDIDFSFHPFWAAVAGLAVNYSAYEAEIYRAGIQAIPKGQMEAALSLGMSRGLALRRVIVPQATRLVLPPMTNDFIALFKDTAVCSVITVIELSKEYYVQARSTGAIVELGLLTAFLYLAMSYPLSMLTNYLERRLSQERRA